MIDATARFTTFGELLRYLRRRQRLTQIDLAIATGYSTGQISRLEQNQRVPNPDTVRALFVPALGLEHEPELVTRLFDLARSAHGTRPTQSEPREPLHDPLPENGATGSDVRRPATAPSVPVVRTKLFVPRPRPQLVARARLLARLHTALDVPLTLVSAPTGWGKTSLVSQWLAAEQGTAELRIENAELRNRGVGTSKQGDVEKPQDSLAPFSMLDAQFSVAWLSLDEGDNTALTFLRSLIAALQTVDASIGTTALALMQAPQSPGPDQRVQSLLNDLARLEHGLVLVLDDYHLLTAPDIHDSVALLLEHIPPTLHLVLVTRADPPLPLARLRARGQVLELRASDLRFTPLEATGFLRDVMGLPLSDGDIAALDMRTEGWIAGLQLAALAMRHRGDVSAFINAFTGSNRFVVDYLATEVFERQAPHVQAFLLQTSILDRLCGPLCDAVLGVEHGTASPQAAYTQAVLEEIERANLFVMPLDDERQWYRYHHLFGEVLHERLVNGAAETDIVRLHRRAGNWFARQGSIDEAISHLLAAGEPEQSARLIEQRAESLIINGEMTTLRRWIERLPDELIHGHRRIALAYAGVLLSNGDVLAVEPLLQAAERADPPDDLEMRSSALEPDDAGDRGWLDDLATYTTTMRSIVARVEHRLQAAIELGRAALEHLPARFVFMRSAAAWNIGIAYQLNGDLTGADEAISTVIAANLQAGQVYAFVSATTSLAQVRLAQGRLHEAATLYRRALRHAAALDVQIPSLGMLHIGLADVLREWNDLEAAARHLADGIALGKAFGSADALVAGYTTLARVYLAQGDEQAADVAFAQVERLTPGTVFSLATPQRARIWIARGELAAAEAWATRNGLRVDDQARYEYESEHLVLARVLLARRAWAAALALLERLLQAAEPGGRVHSVIEILTLQALALQSLKHPQRALDALERAIGLAEPEGYIRVFVDEGAPLAALLSALHRPAAAPYLATLRSAFAGARAMEPLRHPSEHPGKPVKPLSEREREVIGLMSEGLGNREIAARLVVGVSTVKKHINSIFGKLGVHSRTEALARASELDLA